ncbi:transketolase [Chlorobium sp.]|jgi:transketolase|uniref:transketolase n=1 Tax=Chlorobium sp. TaxID=1095 RepID=UPI003C421FE6|nr:transketolase [Chlorobiaceae bacterium]
MAKDLALYPADKKGELLELASIDDLKTMATQVRRDIIRMLALANSGHTGGSLGMADIFTALYFRLLRQNPHAFREHGEEDMVFLSNGHIAPVWYSVLARSGYFPIAELASLRQLNSYLQGHPTSESGLPGIRIASGSLGQGLSAAVGAALGNRIDGRLNRVFCLMGDGECQEGQIWEAAMSAAHYGLGNLIGIVDYNNAQIDGEVRNIMNIEPFADKWRAFGWEVFSCDGNDIEDVIAVVGRILSIPDRKKPSIVLAKTLMGKGVPFFEGTMADGSNWHGKPPSKDDALKALELLGETRFGDFPA